MQLLAWMLEQSEYCTAKFSRLLLPYGSNDQFGYLSLLILLFT